MRKNHCSSCLTSTIAAAALAAPVDHLLVGEHGLVLRAPLDRRLLAVGEAALVQAQEDPLRPAVVLAARGCRTRASSRWRCPSRGTGAGTRAIDVVGRLARVLARLDRVVLGREAERVVAHRVQDRMPGAAPEVRHRVADRVVLQVPDVRLAGRVGQHLEHVGGIAPGGRRRSRPPRCARRPKPPATWARSSSGRSDPPSAEEVTCGACGLDRAAKCRREIFDACPNTRGSPGPRL